MKHLASIQIEFIKEARKWEDMSLEDQRGYLKRHPKSKRRLTGQHEKSQEKLQESKSKKTKEKKGRDRKGTAEQRLKFFRKLLGSRFEQGYNELHYYKNHGYINNLRHKIREKMDKLGFKSVKSESTPSQPDNVRHEDSYKDKYDNVISFSSFYGATKYDNFHSITVNVPEDKAEAK